MSFRIPSSAELTEEQMAVYDLEADGRFLVAGPPGTGKTILALLRAKRLVRLGKSPSIVLYNKSLGAMVRSEALGIGIADRVHTFDQWITRAYRTATGESIPSIEPWVYDWAAIARHARELRAAKAALDLEYVLVDEAQDLPKEFFGFLAAMGTHLTVFADENQRITERQSTLQDLRSALMGPRELAIRRNFRNTRPVATLARRFYTGTATGIPELPARPGKTPLLVRVPSRGELARAVARIAISDASRKSVGVFVLRTTARDALRDEIDAALPTVAAELSDRNPARRAQYFERLRQLEGRVFAYRTREDPPPLNEHGVFVLCHSSAKGLQFDTCFVSVQGIENHDELTSKMRMYVMASRPEHDLYVTWMGASGKTLRDKVPTWISSVPEEELEHRKFGSSPGDRQER